MAPDSTSASKDVINGVPDPHVNALPRRRSFTAQYKARVLRETDEAKGEGKVGEILRREGLYSSYLTAWRKERDEGALVALGKKRGRKSTRNPLSDEVAQLRRENAKLKARVTQAEVIIDVQKKVAGLLGIPLNAPNLDESDS